MVQRHGDFITFARYFIHHIIYVRLVLAGLLALLVLGGLAVSRLENVDVADGLYFAFITALSIGYGDITPATAWGRLISVGIGLVGMIFVGISVAVATRALADSIEENRAGK